MTKTEAEAKVTDFKGRFNEIQGHKMCPLFHDVCVMNCECIEEPTIYNRYGKPDTFPDDWEAIPWVCGNAMFSGLRYEQNNSN